MNRALFSLLAVFLFAANCWAQVSPEPSHAPHSVAQTPAANQLAAGTVISVELSKSVDAKKVKANDKIEAKTAMDLLSHGQIVIPRNTKIIGHVTEAKAHSKASPDSMVGISFDGVLMKDGRGMPLRAAIQAIGRPLQATFSFAAGDSMSAVANGIPSAGQGQQATIAGTATSTQSPNPTGYPRGGAGLPDPGPISSTVSPLGPTSRGVIGIKGLSLNSSGPASVVSSSTDNVHLDGGTQLILRVQ